MPLPLLLLTILIVAACAIWDWRTGEIPNVITLPVLALAPINFVILDGLPGALFSLLGLLAAGLVPYIFFRLGGMGGGDVKLFAAIGSLAGPTLGVEVVLWSVIAACLQALVVAWRGGQLAVVARGTWRTMKNLFLPAARRAPATAAEMISIRMGPAILVGTLLELLPTLLPGGGR